MIQEYNSNKNLVFLILISILFLASNSILCKAALVDTNIDPYSFTFLDCFLQQLCYLYYFIINIKEYLFIVKKTG